MRSTASVNASLSLHQASNREQPRNGMQPGPAGNSTHNPCRPAHHRTHLPVHRTGPELVASHSNSRCSRLRSVCKCHLQLFSHRDAEKQSWWVTTATARPLPRMAGGIAHNRHATRPTDLQLEVELGKLHIDRGRAPNTQAQ